MALLKRYRSFWSAEILPLIREVGYLRPTLLQQKIIPLILKGKDLVVEVEEGSGKTAAFILPIIVKSQRGKHGIKAVVLTNTLENSRKIYHEFRRFLPQGKRKLSLFAFGVAEDVRKENRILLRTPDVLIGTPSRIIDHIRRDNLRFSHLQTVIIDEPIKREKPGFDEDIQFIFSKFPLQKQTILFSPSFNGCTDVLISVLKRPVIIPVTSWSKSSPSSKEVFLETDEKEKLSLIFRLILAWDMDSLLILCRDNPEVKSIVQILLTRSFKVLYLIDDLPSHKQLEVLKAFNKGNPSILVSTFTAVRQKSPKWVSHILCFDVPPFPEAFSPKSFSLRKTIFLGTNEQFIQLQEKRKVDIIKKEFPTDDEVIRGSIQRILKKIKEEEDPLVLNRYRKIVRKNVPIFLRSYFMAYLFKLNLNLSVKSGEKFTKLFVSVGKNKRVYPKDLINLFTTKLNIKRSEIGNMKILDNYSFIDIYSSYAEKAIDVLSGTEFKGRPITVNFARKKEEKKT